MIQTSSRAPVVVGRALVCWSPSKPPPFCSQPLTHLGVGIPFGVRVVREPRIVDATVAEGLHARADVGDRRLRGP